MWDLGGASLCRLVVAGLRERAEEGSVRASSLFADSHADSDSDADRDAD